MDDQWNFHNNLPKRNDGFVNRVEEIAKIVNFLYDREIRFLSITGEGGVGKTTLALEVAYRAINRLRYKYCIWTTAKRKELGFSKPTVIGPVWIGIKRRSGLSFIVRSLFDLYKLILDVTEHPDIQNILEMEEYDIQREIRLWLKYKPSLVIIDDLDSWKDWGDLLSFIENLPPPSSILITTRRLLSSRDIPGLGNVAVSPLPMNEGRRLVETLCKELNTQFSEKDKHEILNFARGNPLLIKLTISYLTHNTDILGRRSSIATSLKNISYNRDITYFLYSDLYSNLTKQAKLILVAAVVYENIENSEPSALELRSLTGLDEIEIDNSLQQLEELAFIKQSGEGPRRLDIHELAKKFIYDKEKSKVSALTTKIMRMKTKV